MSEIKVIGFDLDDTLWDNQPVMLKAESKLNQWLHDTVPQLLYDVSGMREIRLRLLETEPQLSSDLTELRRKVIQLALIDSGLQTNDAKNIADAAMEIFLSARNQVTFFSGAITSLQTLSARFVLGSLSNGNSSVKALGLDNYLSFAFSAADVGAAKPAPDLFMHALTHTGIEPSQMIYVGDDPLLDIDAANNVGLKTIWLNRKNKPLCQTKPDQIITDISDIVEAVSAIQRNDI